MFAGFKTMVEIVATLSSLQTCLLASLGIVDLNLAPS